MNHFPSALDRVLKQASQRFTASEFAKSALCSPSDVSRLRKGNAEPGHYVRNILASPLLERDEARQILIGYLRDEVPADLIEDVSINLTDRSGVIREGEKSPLDVSLEYLRRRAHEDPAFTEWLNEFVAMLQTSSTPHNSKA